MNEEIDIIELLKRIKEGNAPKEIEIEENKLFYHPEEKYFERLYQTKHNSWWSNISFVTLDTKIKILDKPKIEKLTPVKYGNVVTVPDRDVLMDKINEIIDYLNKNV